MNHQQQQAQQGTEESLMVEFVAPCDLPENSEVEVEIDGKPRIAIVPLGRDREDETATAPVTLEQQSSSPAYTGSTTGRPQQQGEAIPEGAPPFATPIVAQTERVDPENPQGYQLTLFRKRMNFQGCQTWKLSANGQEIGSLPNGGSLAVRGNVGDKLELHMGGRCKSSFTTFEMIIKRPGKLNLNLTQTGDVTFWTVLAICLISLSATAAGFVLGLVPLLLGLAAASTSIYKYCKAGWHEITSCEPLDEDLLNGSIVRVTTRGCCG